MLFAPMRDRLEENYKRLVDGERASGREWRPGRPVLITSAKKSERMAHPFLGVIPAVNLYSSNLQAYCDSFDASFVDHREPEVGRARRVYRHMQIIEPGLRDILRGLCPRPSLAARPGPPAGGAAPPDPEAVLEFTSAVATYRKSRECRQYLELRAFLTNLSSFLNGCYVSRSHCIELFQKQLILHTFYFLVSIKAPEATDSLFYLFKDYFGLTHMTTTALQTFKQKASVFLIPRRHGKTWIVVAIVSMLLTSVENIHVGYVAHQKHVANSVFTEIINTLYRWFPGKSVEVKKENSTVIYRREGARPSTLMCATCFNKNSIRGQTFNLLYIDEANFIKKDALPSILGFMLQKNAKLIFISSSNSTDKSTSFLYRLKNAHERLLNVVSYVCPEHRDDFNMQETLVSCPCYRLHIPVYITIDEDIKTTTNLFLEGAFTTELMGDCGPSSTCSRQIVSDLAVAQLDTCRIDTTDGDALALLDATLYVYIDPAYTNNCDASGTGIGAVVLSGSAKDKCLILGLEHFFLKDLTGAASLQIASCAASLIKSISILHPNIKQVFAAVEGNSSQDSAVAIATVLDECCSLPVYFSHYSSEKGNGLQYPVFILGNEKTKAFETFIYALNIGSVSASQAVVSNTIKLSHDPVAYLLDQVKCIRCLPLRDGRHTYSAKHKNASDDVLVAVIMAHFLAWSDKHSFKQLHPHPVQFTP
ncbi:DNA packaging terminase subunit 1 [Common bottlenose dolphin gammaherpesvirus 1 strain Sarasota]|uniref:DNA packaging terminase subunit 1 n=1 Tax=Common bottlenose dolphin gammaherpesvirus 1 strain Sarasota TaxID=2022783 RepID=A0A1Z1NEE9_9GAMA|nr:DNA packaging terminase subunit 1 [Common bottlenose dolphin gammaherpesvirus 1 strain Sarasota]ARW78092.1 DNA packaging terminase subunit 1 [Common bottlenose dolphin gammaherpesvirus 1 strain Sarasota]